jgi:hypothetical protein
MKCFMNDEVSSKNELDLGNDDGIVMFDIGVLVLGK